MKKPRAKYPERSRINADLPADLRVRLDAHCAAMGIYNRAVIEKSIRQYLDGTSDMTLLYRRIDRTNRSLNRLAQQLELQGQFLCEFVQLWLHNTPPLPQPDQQATRRQAAAAYRRLLDRTAASMSSGKTFIDELPKDLLTPIVEESPIQSETVGP